MEPVKGGTLAAIPAEAEELLHGEAPAHRALRFAASREGVVTVLSGMSTEAQVEENTQVFSDFRPLSGDEEKILEEVAGIAIPQLFALYNEHRRDGWQANAAERYRAVNSAPASACLTCRQCESSCPQKLPIMELLQQVSEAFEPKK
jgi:predicted aldo/keto reductase-like oxidoreductase